MDVNQQQMLFVQLVSMFHSAAMMQLGKIKDPITDKIERDIERAQYSIDILDMLMIKMKGNLSAEEEKFLSSVTQELKLNFVDEKAKETGAPKQ